MPDHDARRIAAIGAVLASETRASILCALIGGTAHTQTELARTIGLSPSSISEHVGVLIDHGFVVIEAQGRHRYVRLASGEIAELVERLSSGIGTPVPLPRLPAELGFARSCYGHLAGALGVRMYDAFVDNGWLVDDGDQVRLTKFGADELHLPAAGPRRCLDWSQRRPHLGGPAGVALLTRCIETGWLRRHPDRPRVIQLTERGSAGTARRLPPGVAMTDVRHSSARCTSPALS